MPKIGQLPPLGRNLQDADRLIVETPAGTRQGVGAELLGYVASHIPDPTVLVIEAGQTLSGQMAVVAVDGKAYYADNSNIAHAGLVVGVTTGAAMQGATASIRLFGEMTEPSWDWTPNLPILLGRDGRISQSDTATAFSQILGFALSGTTIFINLEPPILRQ